MEDHTRNLLVGIGQPDFSYRRFNEPDPAALIGKWPLLGLIARLPEMRATSLWRDVRRGGSDRGQAGDAARDPQTAATPRPGFLGTYGNAAAPADAGSTPNVRALLDRLAEDMR